MSRYDVKAILESNTLPIGGGAAKRLKEAQALECSRKREEMIALGTAAFQYGGGSSSNSNSNSSRLQPYTLMMQQQQHLDLQTQPLLSLQNQQEVNNMTSQYSLHPSYIQTQLQLHHQTAASSYNNNSNSNNFQSSQLYNGYLQSHPALLQGLMNMENEGGGGSGGGFMGMGSNTTSSEEFTLVKAENYSMPAGNYGGWSTAETMQQPTSNAALFTMWND